MIFEVVDDMAVNDMLKKFGKVNEMGRLLSGDERSPDLKIDTTMAARLSFAISPFDNDYENRQKRREEMLRDVLLSILFLKPA